MRRPRLVIPAALMVAALALAGCDSDGESTDTSAAPAATETEAGASSDAEAPANDDGANDSPAGDDADAPDDADEGDSDLPVGDLDPDGGAGPDDDAVSYPATGSVLAPECGVVVHHPIEHEVRDQTYTEVPGGFECLTVVDSKGDALFFANEIGAQLDEAGYEQTSWHGDDDSEDAVNVFSYLIDDGELYVTVRQAGPASLETTYAFISPARGNG